MRGLILPFVITALLIVVVFLLFGSYEQSTTQALERLKVEPFQYSLYSFVVLVSDIVLPVPSSIVMYLNGFVLGVWSGSVLSFGSLMLSSVIGYFIGNIFGIKRSRKTNEKTMDLLQKYGSYAILITRGIPILSESVCFVCGYNRIPFGRYMIFNAVGFIPICTLYGYLGTVGGDQEAFGIALLASVLITAIFFAIGRILQHKQRKAI